ncbi:MAG: hypothetical protein KatS3mg076_2618 [Candidatus Binatia bacterium]|nr:MAG: hypothetical protein KatS3mg076_2618 [Candidatus Binatia bacterium]
MGAEREGQRLVFGGVLLLGLALLTGAVIPHFTNPRMGLAAHVTGIEAALVLAVFGLLWSRLELGERAIRAAYVSNLAGLYALWIAFVFGAALGTGRATPIAGAGFVGPLWAEAVFSALLYAGVLGSLVGTLLVLLGLGRALRGRTGHR